MRTDVHRGYNGYLIEAGRYRVVFGGDTAYTDTFRAIRSSKAVDLAIMPIGAYDPWIHAHCNPEQAMAMADQAGADFVLPVHHQTFQLSSEGYREPIERLVAAAGDDRVAVREIGEEFHLGARMRSRNSSPSGASGFAAQSMSSIAPDPLRGR
jgi:L-ascorbate metabolism protein UlaG (beta-lactamase superfamily)